MPTTTIDSHEIHVDDEGFMTQYDEWTEDQLKGDAGREEFHRFVLDVALAFRAHARERSMRDSADFRKWWKRAEGPDGLFC